MEGNLNKDTVRQASKKVTRAAAGDTFWSSQKKVTNFIPGRPTVVAGTGDLLLLLLRAGESFELSIARWWLSWGSGLFEPLGLTSLSERFSSCGCGESNPSLTNCGESLCRATRPRPLLLALPLVVRDKRSTSALSSRLDLDLTGKRVGKSTLIPMERRRFKGPVVQMGSVFLPIESLETEPKLRSSSLPPHSLAVKRFTSTASFAIREMPDKIRPTH